MTNEDTQHENEADPEFEDMIKANLKRTYDAYQEVGLESIKRARSYADLILANAANQSAQVLQGAITHAADLNKQSIRHADLAVNKHWNLEPSEAASEAVVLRSVTLDDASLKAIGAIVAVAVAEVLAAKDTA